MLQACIIRTKYYYKTKFDYDCRRIATYTNMSKPHISIVKYMQKYLNFYNFTKHLIENGITTSIVIERIISLVLKRIVLTFARAKIYYYEYLLSSSSNSMLVFIARSNMLRYDSSELWERVQFGVPLPHLARIAIKSLTLRIQSKPGRSDSCGSTFLDWISTS